MPAALGNQGKDRIDEDLKTAIALWSRGRTEDALRIYRNIVRNHPKCAPALVGLGVHAMNRGQLDRARLYFRRALAADKASVDARLNLGYLFLRESAFENAERLVREALALRPELARAHLLHARILRGSGQSAAALTALTRAYELDASHRTELITSKLENCSWEGLDELFNAARDDPHFSSSDALVIASRDGSMSELFDWSRAFGSRLEALAIEQLPLSVPPRPSTHRIIRLGYVSGDFRLHPTSLLMIDVLKAHDRSRFEVHAFSYGQNDRSSIRADVETSCDVFHDIRLSSDRESAQLITESAVDILIDLNGYTLGARPLIAAQRPAPLQVNYLGFPGSMGAGFIDYVIADEVVCPFEFQEMVTERIVHLPGSFQPNSKRLVGRLKPTRETCNLPANAIVFCSFNAEFKLTPVLYSAWMRLLEDVPSSILWMLASSSSIEASLRLAAEKAGVDSTRIVFAPRVSSRDHLARIALADMSLDTAPIGGFTTASDSLWAGVPVLTILGQTPPGRGAASLLTALGLQELIARDCDAYLRIARAFAADPDKRMYYRELLAEARLSSIVFDVERFTLGLEAAFQEMHARRVANLPPVSFRVKADTYNRELAEKSS